MTEKTTTHRSRKNAITILACLSVVLLFFFGLLFPQMQTIAQLDQEITTLKPRIAEQKILLPLYQSIKEQLGTTTINNDHLPAKSTTALQDINRLPDVFEKNASASQLKLKRFTPDINSISENEDLMKIDLYVTGNFFCFHRFLFETCNLPFLRSIEQLDIRTMTDSEDMELHLRVCFDRH